MQCKRRTISGQPEGPLEQSQGQSPWKRRRPLFASSKPRALPWAELWQPFRLRRKFTADGLMVSMQYDRVKSNGIKGIGPTIFAICLLGMADSINAGWYDSNWDYRQQITIHSNNVVSTETNFPVLIKLTNENNQVFVNAQSDGDDILFTASDGTNKLDHQIEYYTNSTKELDAWVRIPTLISNLDTVIYMYYGNNDASNQQNAGGVWEGSFKMVQHLSESPSNDVACHIDSTTNANNGTPKNFGTGTGLSDATGKIAGAVFFGGTNESDYIDCGTNASLNITNVITLEAWVKPAVDAAEQDGSSGTVTAQNGWKLCARDSGNLVHFRVYIPANTPVNGTTELSSNVWYYTVGVYDGMKIRIYVNGIQENETPITGGMLYFVRAYIGWDQGGGSTSRRNFNGIIDEARISDAVRSPGWIATCYTNQVSPETFISCGDQEKLQPPGTVIRFR